MEVVPSRLTNRVMTVRADRTGRNTGSIGVRLQQAMSYSQCCRPAAVLRWRRFFVKRVNGCAFSRSTFFGGERLLSTCWRLGVFIGLGRFCVAFFAGLCFRPAAPVRPRHSRAGLQVGDRADQSTASRTPVFASASCALASANSDSNTSGSGIYSSSGVPQGRP